MGMATTGRWRAAGIVTPPVVALNIVTLVGCRDVHHYDACRSDAVPGP